MEKQAENQWRLHKFLGAPGKLQVSIDAGKYDTIFHMGNLQAIIHKCEPPETGYWAEVPSLPGCVTEGETLEEVRAMIQDAVSAWFASAWDLAMAGRTPSAEDIYQPVYA